ncbi:MAG TPA: flagellar biosynthesis protein FlhB [Spongiibacteraceae bacterium]|nr:flagellar biosynthesis protein FlhB [Spongiibacteraceae bacterium]HCS27711.1 flagellar biosynthesis protein FlhB [Spongiibacteraceae bacterium]|tara:strand:+ start:264 stop:1391 length:1128 start_codon:yes stop_codon:yes gene_type:complete
MAEESGQERTEEATPKKLEEAKKKGQVPRSKELATTLVTLAGACMLLFSGKPLADGLLQLFSKTLSADYLTISDPQLLPSLFFSVFVEGLLLVAPLMAVAMVAAAVSAVALGGWTFSLSFKPERMNPVSGLAKLFSLKSLVELAKSVGKLLFVGGAALAAMMTMQEDIQSLVSQSADRAVASAAQMLALFFLLTSLPLIAIAAIDVPFQKWNHSKELKMTKQEIRDEMKDTDGRPEVKSKLREMQQAAAQRRMMEDVPKADVVITNPTHYSVALKYDERRGGAPVVLAKGADVIAAKIRERATESDVPIVESPRLARAVFATTDIGGEIPGGLYLAVAQILAYVYQLRDWQARGGDYPEQPEPRVDDEYLKGLNT